PSDSSKDVSFTTPRPLKDLEMLSTARIRASAFARARAKRISAGTSQRAAGERRRTPASRPARRTLAGTTICELLRRPRQTEAADDRAEDQLDRARDVEDLLGEQVVVVEGEYDAGERGHGRRQHDGVHLVAEDVDAERLRRLRAFADRQPVVAQAAAQQRVTQ